MATSGALPHHMPDDAPSGASLGGQPPAASARPDAMKAIPVRHWGRWLAAAIIFVLVAGLIFSLARNPNIGWGVIGQYLFSGLVLRGTAVTIELTVIAMIIGVIGGTLIAVMRLSGNPVLTVVAQGYIWLFRGTPLLVQLLFWNFLGALYPRLFLALPFSHFSVGSVNTNAIIGGFTAAILGLGLNEMAYASELVRAGIISVDKGQIEAAQSLGMSSPMTMRRIILPQAMRIILPPMGNETISMLKTTSLVIVISGTELLSRIQQTYAQTFQEIPLLLVASIWYLALTTVLSIGQYYLERHYSRGSGYQTPKRRNGGRGRRWPMRSVETPEEKAGDELHSAFGQERR
jgi:polar amino acid transport system permease protein